MSGAGIPATWRGALARAMPQPVQNRLARSRWVRWAFGAAGIVLLYVLPTLNIPILGTEQTDFASVLFYPVGIYVLMAIGLNVMVGYAGMLNLGYVAFFGVGGYTMAVLGTKYSVNYFVALPAAVAVAMIVGVVLCVPTLRLRGVYLAIVTLGFGSIAQLTANNVDWIGGARGITGIPSPPDVGGLTFGILDSVSFDWLLFTLILLCLLVVRLLNRSRIGRGWAAIREDETAAALMGVPVQRFKLWAFAVGAGIGGAGGATYAARATYFSPENITLMLSVLFLASVILGGAGNLPGVIAGAVLVAYLPERFRQFGDLRVLLFALALVIAMIYRPGGLFPSRQRRAEATLDGEPLPVPQPAGHSEMASPVAGGSQ